MQVQQKRQTLNSIYIPYHNLVINIIPDPIDLLASSNVAALRSKRIISSSIRVLIPRLPLE